LVGGNGRDLLIGGIGKDRLVGNPDDDVLIAGSTDYDSNDQALSDIMKEWTRIDADFATRVAHLRGDSGAGVGLNGSVLLTQEGPGATVHDDGVMDVLTGSAGVDWFLLNQDGDNATAKDKVTDLGAEEFASDIDFITGP
jgi:Ca2+-binding RTX toxin-like protein